MIVKPSCKTQEDQDAMTLNARHPGHARTVCSYAHVVAELPAVGAEWHKAVSWTLSAPVLHAVRVGSTPALANRNATDANIRSVMVLWIGPRVTTAGGEPAQRAWFRSVPK